RRVPDKLRAAGGRARARGERTPARRGAPPPPREGGGFLRRDGRGGSARGPGRRTEGAAAPFARRSWGRTGRRGWGGGGISSSRLLILERQSSRSIGAPDSHLSQTRCSIGESPQGRKSLKRASSVSVSGRQAPDGRFPSRSGPNATRRKRSTG